MLRKRRGIKQNNRRTDRNQSRTITQIAEGSVIPRFRTVLSVPPIRPTPTIHKKVRFCVLLSTTGGTPSFIFGRSTEEHNLIIPVASLDHYATMTIESHMVFKAAMINLTYSNTDLVDASPYYKNGQGAIRNAALYLHGNPLPTYTTNLVTQAHLTFDAGAATVAKRITVTGRINQTVEAKLTARQLVWNKTAQNDGEDTSVITIQFDFESSMKSTTIPDSWRIATLDVVVAISDGEFDVARKGFPIVKELKPKEAGALDRFKNLSLA